MINTYQQNTSAEKLRGEFYTPVDLIELMLKELAPTLLDRIIDPSCGEGRFLCETARFLSAGCVGERAVLLLAENLIGFDIDEHAVEAARSNLHTTFAALFGLDIPPEQFRIYRVDVLSFTTLAALFQSVALSPLADAERLLVIGNPPYVEAKRLEQGMKSRLKELYGTAMLGAPDLYLYFMHVCRQWLRSQDMLAFVLPNKILVNSNARQVRVALLDNAQLAGIWFATQAQIFPSAAVYPVILFLHGRNSACQVQIRHIERIDTRLQLSEEQTMSPDLYQHTEAKAFFPLPRHDGMCRLLERLLMENAQGYLRDVLTIRWSVSFHRSGLRERFVTNFRPTSDCAQPFLGGGAFSGNGEVRRYSIDWDGWWIDYDEARLLQEGNAVPGIALFKQPKIAICQNSRTVRAAFDEDAYVLKDTFLCGLACETTHPLTTHPRAIVGLLNSQIVHFIYSHLFYGGHVNGGYLHFLGSFLDDIPLGSWSDSAAQDVAKLVLQLEKANLLEDQQEIEANIEEQIRRVFALTPSEDELLQAWLGADENWNNRDRIRTVTR